MVKLWYIDTKGHGILKNGFKEFLRTIILYQVKKGGRINLLTYTLSNIQVYICMCVSIVVSMS